MSLAGSVSPSQVERSVLIKFFCTSGSTSYHKAVIDYKCGIRRQQPWLQVYWLCMLHIYAMSSIVAPERAPCRACCAHPVVLCALLWPQQLPPSEAHLLMSANARWPTGAAFGKRVGACLRCLGCVGGIYWPVKRWLPAADLSRASPRPYDNRPHRTTRR